MNDKFDELARGLAQSVTRRAALKKFGVGLAGLALALLGLANKAQAGPKPKACLTWKDVKRDITRCDCSGLVSYAGCCPNDTRCLGICAPHCS